jgi:hypothetical protein
MKCNDGTLKDCHQTLKNSAMKEANCHKNYTRKVKGTGKVHPRTGHKGPEGEQRYSSTLSLTSALDGGEWSTPHPGRFTPRKDAVPIV